MFPMTVRVIAETETSPAKRHAIFAPVRKLTAAERDEQQTQSYADTAIAFLEYVPSETPRKLF